MNGPSQNHSNIYLVAIVSSTSHVSAAAAAVEDALAADGPCGAVGASRDACWAPRALVRHTVIFFIGFLAAFGRASHHLAPATLPLGADGDSCAPLGCIGRDGTKRTRVAAELLPAAATPLGFGPLGHIVGQ
jgi:hypothetical protein